MSGPGDRGSLDIEVALARPERQQVLALSVPSGCTAREAVALAIAAGLEPGAGIDPERGPIGVYGERVEDTRALREGDRVELYRPLARDPKARRRAHAARTETIELSDPPRTEGERRRRPAGARRPRDRR